MITLFNMIFQILNYYRTEFGQRIGILTEIERLIAELQFMEHDQMLVDFLARERRHQRKPYHEVLHDYLKECQKITKNSDANAHHSRLTDTLPPSRQESWPIVDYLSRLGLYGPIFAYLSRFAAPPCKEVARVFEKSQYQICERKDYLKGSFPNGCKSIFVDFWISTDMGT